MIDIYTSRYGMIDSLKLYTYTKIYLLNKQLRAKYSDPVRRELVMKTILHSLFTNTDTKRIKTPDIIKIKENMIPENYTSYDSFFSDYINNRVKINTGITFLDFMNRPIKEMESLIRNCKKANQISNSVMNSIGDLTDELE